MSHPRAAPLALLPLLLSLTLLLGACGAPAFTEAPKAPWPGPFTVPTASPTAPPPVRFPRDEAPHDVLTEWWYYTGHLRAADGASYGFETVIFQSRRANFPPFYAAHTAITDRARRAFHFDQRAANAVVGTGPGFDLQLGDWRWRGLNGRDQVAATVDDEYAFQLDLTGTKPPALHEGGYIDFGSAGGSYYYSRTRMAVTGTVTAGGVTRAVTGEAWFDHQWGNFLGTATGGWDWFSAQLADGSDFTLSLLRDSRQALVGAYGTFVDPAGKTTRIAATDITVEATGRWTSPTTGVTYPSGWRVTLPKQGLSLEVTPVIRDQELDTRATTGTIYWEGEVAYRGTRDGAPLTGEGYVELTGYDRR